jgi:proline dehydrogenase
MARNDWMRRHLPNLWFARRAVRKFMPGETPEAALDAAAKLKGDDIGVLFTRLGETLTGVDDGDATAEAYLALMADARARGLSAEVSVKLTQLGFDIDEDRTLEHCKRLADSAAKDGRTVWIDMEGSDYTESTIAFYERLKQTHPNTGLCLQAYLHRTDADVDRLAPIGPRIRLVKGAYAEPASIAYKKGKEVDANYLALSQKMLDLVKGGSDLFFGLGTHDVDLIELVADHAEAIGLPKSTFDIEMLYGIRSDQQRRLKSEGFLVRVLIAYGEYWYPWYMRRLAERPANVMFALRQLLP